jgi:hypothetical protein
MRLHVGRGDHHETALAFVEQLTEILEVRTAHSPGDVSSDRPEPSARCAADQQSSGERDGGEECDERPAHQAHAQTRPRTLAGRLLVLLDYLDLAVVLSGNDCRVVGVDQAGRLVVVVDRVIVRDGVVLIFVARREDDQRV